MRTTEQQSNTTVNLPVSTRSEDKHPPTDTALLEAAEKAQPLETIKYWADAYASKESCDHFQGHGMVVTMLREYYALRAAIEAHKGKA